MKRGNTKYRYLIQLAFSIIITALFTFPLAGFGQSPETIKKFKLRKTIRVFYGQASFYSNKFNGRRTASGEIFSQKKLTCACNVLPLGTWIKVTNMRNGKSVVVKTNDRLHPKMKRIVDLSNAAAHKLGYVSSGLTRVKVELVHKRTKSP